MFDGNGNWISNFSAVADRNADIKILASRFDNIFIADLADSFENCLTKDAQVKPTTNFDANNFRIIDVANPVADNDAVNLATLNDRIAKVEQDPILAYKWSDYEINDQSWLNANTFSWNDGTVYTNAYTHLYNDIQDVTSSTETIGSYTITYYQAEDGHKIVMADQETTVQNIYNESGVAWYYILDTTNQRFKLPRENPNLEKYEKLTSAGVAIKGNGIALGVTDGSVSCSMGSRSLSGQMSFGMSNQSLGASIGSTTSTRDGGLKAIGITTDATKSGIVGTANLSNASSDSFYKGKQYLYFYVGQFSQSATEQTAGLNAELFNGKMDLDLGNITPSGKSYLAGIGMPSSNYENITVTTSDRYLFTSYEAPANGYICVKTKLSSTGKQMGITIRSTSDSSTDDIYGAGYSYDNAVEDCFVLVPIKKGLYATCSTNSGTTYSSFLYARFIYAEGEI